MGLSLRGKLIAFFVVLSAFGVALISGYLLNFYAADKRQSLRQIDLSAFHQRGENLVNLIQFAQVVDSRRARGSNEIVFLADGSCDPAHQPLITIARGQEAHLSLLELAPSMWTNSLDFFLACKNVREARERGLPVPTVQLIPAKLELAVPYLALLFSDAKTSRLAVVSMDELLYPSGSLVYLVDRANTIVWSADPAAELQRVFAENGVTPDALERLLKRAAETGASGTSELDSDTVVSYGSILGRWTLVTIAYLPVISRSVFYAFRQILLLAIGMLGINAMVALRFSDFFVKPLQELRASTEQIGAGNLAFRFQISGEDEIEIVKRSFNVMTEKISSLIDEIKKRVEVDSELKLAREVEGLLIPANPVILPLLEIHARQGQREGFTGEWWGIADLTPSARAAPLRAVLIADIMERGTPSALAVAALRGSAAVLESWARATPARATDPRWVLAMLRQSLDAAGDGKFRPSILVALLNSAAGSAQFAGAGTIGGFHILPSPPEAPPGEARVTPIAFVEGTIPSLAWTPGAKIVMHTPRILEAGTDGRKLSATDLRDAIAAGANQNAGGLLGRINQARVKAVKGGDFTLLVCEALVKHE